MFNFISEPKNSPKADLKCRARKKKANMTVPNGTKNYMPMTNESNDDEPNQVDINF